MIPDPWEKAADCERAMRATIDPQRQAILERLRNLWIGLGDKLEIGDESKIDNGHRSDQPHAGELDGALRVVARANCICRPLPILTKRGGRYR